MSDRLVFIFWALIYLTKWSELSQRLFVATVKFSMLGPYGFYWIFLAIMFKTLVDDGENDKDDYLLFTGYLIQSLVFGYYQYKLKPFVIADYYARFDTQVEDEVDRSGRDEEPDMKDPFVPPTEDPFATTNDDETPVEDPEEETSGD